MLKEFTNPQIIANFGIATEFKSEWVNNGSYLMFLWNDGNAPVQLLIDGRDVDLLPNRITCITYLNKVQIDNSNEGLKILFFNREFYCVHTYDSEVSCNGLLFSGSNISPVLKLNEEETERLEQLLGEHFSRVLKGELIRTFSSAINTDEEAVFEPVLKRINKKLLDIGRLYLNRDQLAVLNETLKQKQWYLERAEVCGANEALKQAYRSTQEEDKTDGTACSCCASSQ